MKAMILAAGRGERLRPLTNQLPKPLVPLAGMPLIDYHLKKLSAFGIRDVVINVCYRAQQIIEHVGSGQRYGLRVTFSDETACCLGTGGGIYKALPLLGQKPFLLLSADIWTDYSFSEALMTSDCLAYLVMVPNTSNHPKGDYHLSGDGKITADEPRLTYGNIAKIDPRLFESHQKSDIFPLAPLFDAAIKTQTIQGEFYGGPWFNVGTSEELALATMHLQNLSECR